MMGNMVESVLLYSVAILFFGLVLPWLLFAIKDIGRLERELEEFRSKISEASDEP